MVICHAEPAPLGMFGLHHGSMRFNPARLDMQKEVHRWRCVKTCEAVTRHTPNADTIRGPVMEGWYRV